MLEKIPFTKLMNLKNVVKIETVDAKKVEEFGLTVYGLSLKKGDEIVLKDGESGYINDELIVRLDTSHIYLHHLKVDEEAKAKKEAELAKKAEAKKLAKEKEAKEKAEKEALEAKAKKTNTSTKEVKTQKVKQAKGSTPSK